MNSDLMITEQKEIKLNFAAVSHANSIHIESESFNDHEDQINIEDSSNSENLDSIKNQNLEYEAFSSSKSTLFSINQISNDEIMKFLLNTEVILAGTYHV